MNIVLLNIVPALMNTIVLIGALVWLIIVRHRLGRLAMSLLGAGLALLTFNLFGNVLLSLSISESIGAADWHVEQIVLTGVLFALIHAVGLGLVIAAALVPRPPANAYGEHTPQYLE